MQSPSQQPAYLTPQTHRTALPYHLIAFLLLPLPAFPTLRKNHLPPSPHLRRERSDLDPDQATLSDLREEPMSLRRERPHLDDALTSLRRPEPPSKPGNGTRFLVLVLQVGVMALALLFFFLFAGIAALVLVHLFVAGRALRRRGGTNDAGRGDARKPGGGAGLSQSELKRLPCSRYSAKGRPSTDCAVCLESLREGERARTLPGCRHVFHTSCVDRWLVRSAACPICRAAVGGSDQGRR